MDRVTGARCLNAGAIGSSIAASICCVGPLALAVLGLGGGALVLKFEPYRPYFLAATGLFLAGSFYLTYRRSKDCEVGACSSPMPRRGRKISLWIVAVIALLVATFPYLSGALF